MGGRHGPQRNQPKLTFTNHSQPLDSIGQAQMCLQSDPKCYEQILKIFYFSEFSTTH